MSLIAKLPEQVWNGFIFGGVALGCFACQRAHDHAWADPVGASTPSTASVASTAVAPTPSTTAWGNSRAAIVWRVLDHAFVLYDGGAPREMWIKLQLEVDGKIVGSFKLAEPACTLGSISDDKHVVAGLSCYYAGGGDYVEVREKGRGDYVVVAYDQSEGYQDEPPQKDNMRTLFAFHSATGTLDEALLAADGGHYEPYGP